MKKLLLTTFLLLSIVFYARCINISDGVVTFTYENREASRVQLSWQGKLYNMQSDGMGNYTFDVKDVSSGLYTYSFVVDGAAVLDPHNIHVMRDCNRYFNYFIVSGEEGDVFAMQDVPHGSVNEVWYKTEEGNSRRMLVYLPPSYLSGKDYFPVLYLFHGTWGDEDAWVEQGRVPQVLDNLIAQGKAQEMIVVMPNENMWQAAAPTHTEQIEHFDKPADAIFNMADGKFEEKFGEIMQFVERQFRTITKKNSRAIAGLSRGGYFAYHISHYYNSLFDYVGLFSATYLATAPSRVYKNIDKDLQRQFKNPPTLYYIAIGKDDFLYAENVLMRQKLTNNGYQFMYVESAGGHEWNNWRNYLVDFLPRLFHANTEK